jgi:hypothetical protein
MTDTLTRVYQDYLVSLLQEMAEFSGALLAAGAQGDVEKIGQGIDNVGSSKFRKMYEASGRQWSLTKYE